MPLIITIGQLTIPSGTNVPTSFISQSDYSRFGAISIFAPASYNGTVTLQAASGTAPTASWNNVQDVSGTNFVIPQGSVVTLSKRNAFDAIRVSGSLPMSASAVFTFMGQITTEAGGYTPFAG